jgi:cytochrome P450
MNTLEGGEDVLQRHLAHVFPAMTRRTLAAIPYWRFFRLPQDRALDRALGEVRKLQEQLVAQTRARLEARGPEAEAEDFLEAMLLARDEAGEPFSDDVVHGNMLTMLLAGEDTTAQSLAWSIHLLCERPDVFGRLREEADRALGESRTPRDFESVQDLPYFDAVISEVMRLQPVAPLIALEAIDDMVVGDVAVPKGTWFDLMMRVPATKAEHFSDPEKFRPERWLQARPHGDTAQNPTPAAGHAHVPQASIPFGSGPRICPGRSLALLEMRVVLATLVHNFDLVREGSADAVYEDFAFTVSPRGLTVRLRPRAA